MSSKVRMNGFLGKGDSKILDRGSNHERGRMIGGREKFPRSRELDVIVRIRTVCGR